MPSVGQGPHALVALFFAYSRLEGSIVKIGNTAINAAAMAAPG